MLVEAYKYYLILGSDHPNYQLILTNYQLRMTKTKYVEYDIVSVNIGSTFAKHP